DSALDPVVEAIKGKTGVEAEKAILALKVCDPAVGSGHFLVGAAHRLARHLARVRALAQGESEPSPLLYQHALRDVIGRCLYGVDVNPMAAAALEELPDDRPVDIRAKELAFRRHEQTEEYRHKKQLADAWCAAFVIRKHFREPGRESSASGITQALLNDLADGRPLPAELD